MNQVVLKKDKSPQISSIISFFKKYTVLGVLIAVATYAIILPLILTATSPQRYELKAGDIAQEIIKAPRTVEDRLATRQKIEEAKKNVPAIYRQDNNITESVMANTAMVFQGIEKMRQTAERRVAETEQNRIQSGSQDIIESPAPNGGSEKEAYSEKLKSILDEQFFEQGIRSLPIQLSKEDILTGLTADANEILELQNLLESTLAEMLDYGIKQENLLLAKNTLREEIQKLPVSNEVKFLGSTIGVSLVQPNMKYDAEATELEQSRAAQQVEKVEYKKGQHIVEAGQPVTANQIAVLKELGLLKDDQVDIPMIVGIALMVLTIEILTILYLVFYEKELIRQPLMLLMISLVVCVVLGIAFATSSLNVYLIPAAMGAMLLTILLKPRVAMILNIATALLIGLMMGNQLGIILMSLIGGMFGTYLVTKPQQRNGLIWAGLVVGFANMTVLSGYELISSGGWSRTFLTSLWGLGSGMLAAVLTVGTLPIWEHVFGIITPIKLVELSNPNHPVLKRLLMEAPGTYHHSIIVANLAESAADAIGSNGLLARVGAYYHDIGKLKRPYFFKENQLTHDNPHDKINATLSTHIITTHTKDGVEFAKQYKVPRILHDFILQHHGTTPVVYFYHKAKNEAEGREVKLEDFRYLGPRPSRPETAIVMMADTVEAAVRALPDPTPGKVEGLVRKLIKEKLDDGQLDECDLTLKDLNSIAKAFMGVLSGIFHQRVQYPNVNLKQEKEEENGASD